MLTFLIDLVIDIVIEAFVWFWPSKRGAAKKARDEKRAKEQAIADHWVAEAAMLERACKRVDDNLREADLKRAMLEEMNAPRWGRRA